MPDVVDMLTEVRRVVKAAGEAQVILGSDASDDDLDALTLAIVRDETLTPEEMWERVETLEVAARQARRARVLASLGDQPVPGWVKRG